LRKGGCRITVDLIVSLRALPICCAGSVAGRERSPCPRVKLTKNSIDSLPTPEADIVCWDIGCAGFGVKVTPKGRKVFVVLYRTGGAGSRVRKFTIGPYGKVTLHQARIAAQKVFAAKPEGRDPAAEKREVRQRIMDDRVPSLQCPLIGAKRTQLTACALVYC
jgi:hypothetical protein